MKSRAMAWFLVALVCLAVSGPAQGAAKRLVWATCCNQVDRHELFQALAREYETQHPDVEIAWVYPSGAPYYDILLTWIAGGSPADIMWLGLGFPRFVDLVLPLNDLVEKSGIEEIHPGMLSMFTWQGQLLGLPFGTSTHTFAYNKELFNEAGVPYPTSEWTWDDLIRMGRLFTVDRSGGNQPTQWGVEIDNLMHALNFGPGFYDADGRRALLNNPVTIAGVQTYADIYSGKAGVSPGPVGGSRIQRFIDGQLAMVTVGIYDQPVVKASAPFDWDLVTFPWLIVDGEPHRSTDMSGEAWSIYKGTNHPQEAQDFVAFLLSKPVMERIVRAGIVVPSQRSLAAVYLESDGPPANLIATMDSMDFGEMLPYAHPVGAEITQLINASPEWNPLWHGELPAAQVLPQWERQVNQLLREYWDQVDQRANE